MELTSGTRLGPYEIVSPIGAGGMGEVYRARDTRLDRTVAIKVLAGQPADRDELRARFDREARAVSRLNHPHICTLHDIGREGEVDFLVMEYVDGETLASRLTRGPLPIAEAIRAAIETADALARAHAAGIVHRDLKPANVMLTRSGVKLLDFGIAKLSAVGDAAEANTRTRPDTLTKDGTTVGTIQYMAPEQLEGKPVDARTDIFAFGAVTYEMITGRPAFAGDSSAALIAAILTSTPPSPASLEPGTPRALDRLIMTCLAKAREERWQSSADLLRELRWLGDPGATDVTVPAQATRPAPRSRVRQMALLAAVLVIGTLLGASLMRWRTATGGQLPTQVVRFPVTMASGDALALVDGVRAGSSLDLSPDGSKLAYVVVRSGRTQLMLRSLDRLEPTALPGTEDASAPFFSPDGEWIGFLAGEKLKKIATGGGAPLILSSVPPVTRGASWAPDGTIYLSPTFSDSLFKIPDAGGTLVPVTTLDKGEANHLLPHVLPGGRAVIFTVWNGGSFAEASVWVWSAPKGRRQKLLDSASGARYASGHLVFARGDALLAVSFDPVKLEVTGSPVPVADDVEINATNGTAQFALSSAGSLVYAARAATTGGSDLVWVDRHGTEQRIPDVHGDFEAARLSPDGRRVALQTLNDIWMCDLATSALRRLTFAGVNQDPVWTPDGTRIALSRPAVGTPPALFWTPADGSGQAEQITADSDVSFPSDWSPDGSVLAFSRTTGVSGGNWDILAWQQNGGKTSAIENSNFNEFQAAFSPDGRWLAYASDLSGRLEVYVRSYPGAGARVPVSSDGGAEPRWGPDSNEIFYVRGNSLMRVAVKTTPELSASKPEVLFEGRYRRATGSPGFSSYSVSSDGRRFLMIKPADSGPELTRLTVVLGALEERNRRARR